MPPPIPIPPRMPIPPLQHKNRQPRKQMADVCMPALARLKMDTHIPIPPIPIPPILIPPIPIPIPIMPIMAAIGFPNWSHC